MTGTSVMPPRGRIETTWLGVLGIYLLGLILGDRSFAYWHLNLGPVPLYVSELVLAVLLGGLLVLGSPPGAPTVPRLERVGWIVFIVAGCQSALRGALHFPLADALRDCAMVYYSAFYLIGRRAAATNDGLARLGAAAAGAVIVKIGLGATQLVATPAWSTQPAAMCLYFAVFILVSLALAPEENRLLVPLSIVAGLAGALLFLYQVRTAWLGFAVGAAALVIFLRPVDRSHLRFGAVALIIALVTSVAWRQLDGRRVAGSLAEMMTFGSLFQQPTAILQETFRKEQAAPPASEGGPAERPLIETRSSLGTSRTRLWMWGDLLNELRDERTWLLGTPMGKPWLPPRIVPWWNLAETKRVDPHNSFLALLYRTGIVGIAAFFVVLFSIFKRALRWVRSSSADGTDRLLIAGAAAGAVYCLGHAATDVTFENPFKGIFVWVLLGIVSARARETR